MLASEFAISDLVVRRYLDLVFDLLVFTELRVSTVTGFSTKSSGTETITMVAVEPVVTTRGFTVSAASVLMTSVARAIISTRHAARIITLGLVTTERRRRAPPAIVRLLTG